MRYLVPLSVSLLVACSGPSIRRHFIRMERLHGRTFDSAVVRLDAPADDIAAKVEKAIFDSKNLDVVRRYRSQRTIIAKRGSDKITFTVRKIPDVTRSELLITVEHVDGKGISIDKAIAEAQRVLDSWGVSHEVKK